MVEEANTENVKRSEAVQTSREEERNQQQRVHLRLVFLTPHGATGGKGGKETLAPLWHPLMLSSYQRGNYTPL
jgi:hypothetical protein